MWVVDRLQAGILPAGLTLDTEAELLGLGAPALEQMKKDLPKVLSLVRDA
jgi:hypothetical protein